METVLKKKNMIRKSFKKIKRRVRKILRHNYDGPCELIPDL